MSVNLSANLGLGAVMKVIPIANSLHGNKKKIQQNLTNNEIRPDLFHKDYSYAMSRMGWWAIVSVCVVPWRCDVTRPSQSSCPSAGSLTEDLLTIRGYWPTPSAVTPIAMRLVRDLAYLSAFQICLVIVHVICLCSTVLLLLLIGVVNIVLV